MREARLRQTIEAEHSKDKNRKKVEKRARREERERQLIETNNNAERDSIQNS